tara:strand:- start:340 stop:1098 length:759 start_codon:yes stop_codon:yes gene_type:complete
VGGLCKDKKKHLKNLKDVCKLISHLEYFIWGGTLLGYHREKDIIDGDDDLDFAMHIKHKDEVIKILNSNGFNGGTMTVAREIAHPQPIPTCEYLLGFWKIIDGEGTLIDFSLYDGCNPLAQEDSILMRFLPGMGSRCGEGQGVSFPKKIVYPIKVKELQGIKVKVPNDSEAVVLINFGKNWETPISNRSDFNYHSLWLNSDRPLGFVTRKMKPNIWDVGRLNCKDKNCKCGMEEARKNWHLDRGYKYQDNRK